MIEEATIRFGTDGWRGRIADDYTFANVRRCAQGFASYLLSKGWAGESVVVGFDKRFDSEHFAAAVAEVLAANGLKAWLTNGPTPTPVIAFAVGERRAKGAINITASHNPPGDNGVKTIPYADAEAKGLIEVFDAAPAYIANLKGLVDLDAIKGAGLKVLVDAMWGNGGGWFPRLLDGGKTVVEEIHHERNPIFPEMRRPEPIPPNVDVGLRETTR